MSTRATTSARRGGLVAALAALALLAGSAASPVHAQRSGMPGQPAREGELRGAPPREAASPEGQPPPGRRGPNGERPLGFPGFGPDQPPPIVPPPPRFGEVLEDLEPIPIDTGDFRQVMRWLHALDDERREVERGREDLARKSERARAADGRPPSETIARLHRQGMELTRREREMLRRIAQTYRERKAIETTLRAALETEQELPKVEREFIEGVLRRMDEIERKRERWSKLAAERREGREGETRGGRPGMGSGRDAEGFRQGLGFRGWGERASDRRHDRRPPDGEERARDTELDDQPPPDELILEIDTLRQRVESQERHIQMLERRLRDLERERAPQP